MYVSYSLWCSQVHLASGPGWVTWCAHQVHTHEIFARDDVGDSSTTAGDAVVQERSRQRLPDRLPVRRRRTAAERHTVASRRICRSLCWVAAWNCHCLSGGKDKTHWQVPGQIIKWYIYIYVGHQLQIISCMCCIKDNGYSYQIKNELVLFLSINSSRPYYVGYSIRKILMLSCRVKSMTLFGECISLRFVLTCR